VDPPLQVQHTRFTCGGVCLALRLHHWLGDAESFFHLAIDWAELYRTGQCKLATPPSHDHEFMLQLAQQANDEKLDRQWEHPSLFVPKPTSAESEAASTDTCKGASTAPIATCRVFRFSSPELAALKAAATTPDACPDQWVSTFEALSAHVQQCVECACGYRR